MTTPTRREPPLARLVGRRPKRGASDAAKTVVTDVQQLLRAEIDLAKAEVAEGVKAKVMGAGFFIGAAIVGWLAIQAFLVWLGFLFALFLPPWAASGLVLLLLLIIIGVLGYLGLRKIQQEASLKETKASIEESKAAATAAVEQAKEHAAEGVEEAKGTVLETVDDIRGRVMERVAQLRGDTSSTNGSTPAPAPASAPVAVELRPATTAAEPAPTDIAPATADELTAAAGATEDLTAPSTSSVRPPASTGPLDEASTAPATSPPGDGLRFPDPPRSAEESPS